MNKIAVGESHSFIISEDGNGYTLGSNYVGQLGLSNTSKKNYYTPQLLSSPNKTNWKLFTCGFRHSIGQTENGEFFVWGKSYNGCNNLTPKLIPNPKNKNEAFVFGFGADGRLGLGSKSYVTVPSLLECPDSSGWKWFYPGTYHCIGLTMNGEAYVWGSNYYAQLGIGSKEDKSKPFLLESPDEEKWKLFACGRDHSIGVTEDGSCYSWGSNEFGQLGLGKSIKLTRTPQLIPNIKLKDVKCGNWYTIGITEDNKVIVFGSNDIGELGLGDTNNRCEPSILNVPSGTKWKSFITGNNSSHTFGETDNGDLYMWGWEGFEKLGLAKSDKGYKPQLIPNLNGIKWKSIVEEEDEEQNTLADELSDKMLSKKRDNLTMEGTELMKEIKEDPKRQKKD